MKTVGGGYLFFIFSGTKFDPRASSSVIHERKLRLGNRLIVSYMIASKSEYQPVKISYVSHKTLQNLVLYGPQPVTSKR